MHICAAHRAAAGALAPRHGRRDAWLRRGANHSAKMATPTEEDEDLQRWRRSRSRGGFPKTAQEASKTAPRRPKRLASKVAPGPRRRAPRPFQDGPGSVQDSINTAQDAPETAQRWHKRPPAPRRPKRISRRPRAPP
eukprot:5769517-Pyramimonas_sp.AAC.1